jgi:hypothetical protein
MPPQTPLLLVDNVFDTVNQYPTGVVTATNERPGHEAFRVADYRRERTSWQSSTTGSYTGVAVDLGVGVARTIDYVYIDRGHNAWGRTINLWGSATGVAPWTNNFLSRVAPAAGTLGGDPTTGWCVTEEGAIWTLFSASPAFRGFYAEASGTAAALVLTGLQAGMRTQLLGYSSTFDEDAGERTQVSATSTAGYRGADKTYSWRTIELALAYIGATEYDASIRAVRELLFKRNQPWVCAMDYGTRPERAWMYQYDGATWGMPKKRAYREGRIRGREVGASLS